MSHKQQHFTPSKRMRLHGVPCTCLAPESNPHSPAHAPHLKAANVAGGMAPPRPSSGGLQLLSSCSTSSYLHSGNSIDSASDHSHSGPAASSAPAPPSPLAAATADESAAAAGSAVPAGALLVPVVSASASAVGLAVDAAGCCCGSSRCPSCIPAALSTARMPPERLTATSAAADEHRNSTWQPHKHYMHAKPRG